MKPPNINSFFARMLVDRLVNEGISQFIISPGSRSTPLTVAAAEHPNTKTKVILDERAGGYYALGYARATGNAPALVCTSGTALANYLPALIEAYLSRLPIVVLSADRPGELQECGANQTINQVDLFGMYAVGLSIDAPDENLDPFDILDNLERAIKSTWVQGRMMTMPLHINLRFREPLAPDEDEYPHKKLTARVAKWYKSRPMDLTGYNQPDYTEAVDRIIEKIDKKKNGIIIAGPESKYRHCLKLGELSTKLKWPILCDIQSQYRFNTMESSGYPIGVYDLFVDCEEAMLELRPGIVLHYGGLPTSKRLNTYLKSLEDIDYIKIQQHERTVDPDGLETERIVANENLFTEQLRVRIPESTDKDFLTKWIKTEYTALTALNTSMHDAPLDEISLPRTLIDIMTTKEALYLSSSMPIRDADSFMPVSRKAVQVGANRGACGIDGVMASACGFSAGAERPVNIVIGDLAFLHDISSLKLVIENDKPVIIIVINNKGGGIFHFLPIADHENVFEEFFGTPHDIGFEHAGDMYGLSYSAPATITDFKEVYEKLLKENKSGIIEIASDRKINHTVHRALRAHILEILQP